MFEFIEKLESKIKDLEARVQQSIMNHNALLGILTGTKEALVEAQLAVEAVAPDSAMAEVLNTAEEIANVIEHAVE